MQNNNQIKKSWYKKWWGIIFITIATLLLIIFIAFSFYVYNLIKTLNSDTQYNSNSYNDLSEEVRKKIEGENNYWTGSAKPKITIVEFADFACSYCEKSFPKIREISIKYKNDVKIIYRDMPLRENSEKLAMAARCAGEQGLFWLMHDKLFQNQGIKSDSDITELAKQIGTDISKFNNCLNSNKYIQQIQKDFSDGTDLEVKGTPTWFINGNKLEGDIPLSVWEEIIGKILQKS